MDSKDDQKLEDEILRSHYEQYESKLLGRNKMKKTDKRVKQIRARVDRSDMQQASKHSVKKAQSSVKSNRKQSKEKSIGLDFSLPDL